MLRTILRTPWWPIALVALILVVGGPLNSVDAKGVIVSDANGLPIAPRDVFFGQRHFAVGEDGIYFIPNLPRGAKVSVTAPGYTRVDSPVTATEVRLLTAIITLNVADGDTGAAIANPEARVGSKLVGKGTDAGIMVIAPAPGKDETIFVCAPNYDPAFMSTGLPTAGIRLKKGTTGCPPVGQTTAQPSESPAGPVITPNPPASPSPR